MKISLNEFKKNNDFLNSILANMPTAIFVADKNFKIISFNNAFSSFFNIGNEHSVYNTTGKVIGCIHAAIEDEDSNCMFDSHCKDCVLRLSIVKTMETGETVEHQSFNEQFIINGKIVNKNFLITTTYFDFNNEKLIMITINDNTKQEEQKKHLKKLNELKNKFLGLAAHDLRNPISVIKMFSSTILNNFNDNLSKEQIEFIEAINKRSDYMLSLVENFLDYSTIEAGKMDLFKTANDYIEFVRDIVNVNKYLAKIKNISINTEFTENELILKFDRNKIEQVLNNLIGNAIKYSDENTSIKIKIRKKGNKVITNIIDQGFGIPQDYLINIFKEYYVVDNKSLSSDERKTGLGLTIVKKIVEAHNGTINVTSEVGKGSNFSFEI